jgi:hypothetical protein
MDQYNFKRMICGIACLGAILEAIRGKSASYGEGHTISFLKNNSQKHPILIDPYLVARMQPPIDKRFPSGLFISPVSQCHEGSTEEELTGFIWTSERPVRTDNTSFDAGEKNTDRTGFVLGASIEHSRQGSHRNCHRLPQGLKLRGWTVCKGEVTDKFRQTVACETQG